MGGACGTCRGSQVTPGTAQQEPVAAVVEHKAEDSSSPVEGLKLPKPGLPPSQPPPDEPGPGTARGATDAHEAASSTSKSDAGEQQHERKVSTTSGHTTNGSHGAKSSGDLLALAERDNDLGARRTVSMRRVAFPEEKTSPFRAKYKVGKSLGKGAFSSVKFVIDRETKDKYAVKIVNVGEGSPARIEDVRRELEVLRSLDHQKVMKFIESFEEGNKVFIVSELLMGGELLNSLLDKGTYTEEDAQTCFSQLLKALSYVHGKGIIHRDLKLENLLLKHPQQVASVKLIDFGMAKYAETPEVKKTVIGTPLYVAPEILEGATFNPYDYPGDMWSAGVVLHILLVGFPPFFDDSEPTLFELIKQCKYTFDDPAWNNVSGEAKDLVSRLLTLNPADRLSANEALEHIFCRGKGSQVRLVDAVDNMRSMMSLKLKGAVKSVMALSRMSMGSSKSAAWAEMVKSRQADEAELDDEDNDEEAENDPDK